MPKKYLTGTLEEQCDFLYTLAQDKMAQGNYTGAAHALKEIVKHQPDYADAAELLEQVQQRKREQRTLVLWGLGGLSVFIILGSYLGVPNDLFLLLFAGVGLVVGYLVGTAVLSFRTGKSRPRDPSSGPETHG